MPLVLDLLRHGDALPPASGGDRARALSPAGREDLERLASHLASAGWRPDRAFTSPLVRARQSARILVARNAPGLTVEVMDSLGPEGSPADVVGALADKGVSRGHVLMVGHQPLLGELAGYLAGTDAAGFAPGTLARVEFAGAPAAGSGVLGWRLRPREIA